MLQVLRPAILVKACSTLASHPIPDSTFRISHLTSQVIYSGGKIFQSQEDDCVTRLTSSSVSCDAPYQITRRSDETEVVYLG